MAGHGLSPTPHLVRRDGRGGVGGCGLSLSLSRSRPTGDGRATAPGFGGRGTGFAAIKLLAQPQHLLPQQIIFGLQGIAVTGDPGAGGLGSHPASTLTPHAHRHDDPDLS
jgi:hypothetical protein